MHRDLERSPGELASSSHILHDLLDPVVIPGDRVSAGDVPDDTLIEDLRERPIVARRPRLVLLAEKIRVQMPSLERQLTRDARPRQAVIGRLASRTPQLTRCPRSDECPKARVMGLVHDRVR